MTVYRTTNPYRRVVYKGARFNERTVCMLKTADSNWSGSIVVTQGSYNTSVGASAGTHSGGGAVDISVRGLGWSSISTLVIALRKAGFAAWYRSPSEGPWPAHIHAIAIGDKELSAAAARQVSAYKAGRNGLANNGRDTGPRVASKYYSPGFLARYTSKPKPKKLPKVRYAALRKVSMYYHRNKRVIPGSAYKAEVKLVQRALRAKGLYKYSIDGLWGPKSAAAYARWQKRMGVKPSKGVTWTTLRHLSKRTQVFRMTGARPLPIVDYSQARHASVQYEKTRKPFKSKASKASVKRIQKALKKEGLYKYKIDGVWGPKSAQGFRRWRTRLGNKSSNNGTVTKWSLDRLSQRTGYFRTVQ